MQIRRIVFISFFVMLSGVALPLMAVLFFASRNTLEQEIGRNLNHDAIMLMEKVDMLMYERMQNVHSWSRLDIIQEARIGDIDKRLSQFLSDVQAGYQGMYHELFFTDARHLIMAADKASIIGEIHQPAETETRTQVPNGEVFVEPLQFSAPPYDQTNLVIRTPVYDRYTSENIGQFYGLFDMQQLFRLLDKASSSSGGEKYIVLLDKNGRCIAASSNLRNPTFLATNHFSDWKPLNNQDVFVHAGQPVTDSQVLVGFANSNGYLGYAQMGWSILFFQSTAAAFLPIHTLWWMFGLVIILTMLLAFLASHWISGRIAKPILALTKWIREVRHLDKLTPPQLADTIEIRELEMAFRQVFMELERSREHVIQTAKLATVGEMSAIMAHEIRTPLGIISTSAQWLQREQGLSPEGREMSQFILDESARLRKLVTTLLECARPREPHMLKQNINDLLNHTVELLNKQAEKKQLHIQLSLDDKIQVIFCDAELLTQAFLNLLLNAIQIIKNGGIIQIHTHSQGRYLSIEFADNGPGISKEDQQRLFEPFFSKREGGIGLGLTVTRQIILAHKGTMSVATSELGGALFILNLPISQE
jgi:signal transduction histidine kinase